MDMPSHRTIQQTFRTHEQEKRRAYETRIRQVDGGSFTPLVFTTAGGAGPAASVFLKHPGSKIAEEKDAPYSQTIWSPCTRTGKKVSRSSKNRALFVNTEWEQVLQVPPELHQHVPDSAGCGQSKRKICMCVLLRIEQESINAVVMLVAHKTLQLQWDVISCFKQEHLDNIFRMTSTLQPCRSAGGRFSAFLFFLMKVMIMHTTN